MSELSGRLPTRRLPHGEGAKWPRFHSGAAGSGASLNGALGVVSSGGCLLKGRHAWAEAQSAGERVHFGGAVVVGFHWSSGAAMMLEFVDEIVVIVWLFVVGPFDDG